MIIKPINKINGAFGVPGDKSITHRAIMFNAAAEGTAVVTNALMGEDCLSTIDCMRKLGAKIDIDGATVTVTGAKKFRSGQNLYVGNSGTTIRLLAGLVAGMGVSTVLSGDDSISKRPMNRVAAPLELMGAKISMQEGGYAPIKIKGGTLNGIEYTMPVASAQVKSAIILAALNAGSPTVIHEPVGTRDHTERMLMGQSADIKVEGNTVTVGRSSLKSINVNVPGDISSAAYLMVLATVLKGSSIVIKNVGVNPTRTGIIDVLRMCGGSVTLLNKRMSGEEPVADIMVEYSEIKPFEIGGDIIPRLIDELPVIAVLACFAAGRSVIKDAAELKVKESNRIDRMVSELRGMGVNIEATEDGMIINGGGVINGGSVVDAGLDHRIAMSIAVAGACSLEGVTIANHQIANVSYPGFYSIFGQEG